MKYTITKLYQIMYDNNLQDYTFEDALIYIKNMKLKSNEIPTDTTPMIGLNPFKDNCKQVKKRYSSKDFNESLNHRVSEYKKD